MSESQVLDDNINTVILGLLMYDLREVHIKRKARCRNRSYQSNNVTLDEYFQSSITHEENRIAYDNNHDFRQSSF